MARRSRFPLERGIWTIGVICGSLAEMDICNSGCIAIYQSQSALFANFEVHAGGDATSPMPTS
ncbi:hypothetical protein V1282_001403 [Nitrobacteraceae bacterium AZCC 2146]